MVGALRDTASMVVKIMFLAHVDEVLRGLQPNAFATTLSAFVLAVVITRASLSL
jgi:hypothetical protein